MKKIKYSTELAENIKLAATIRNLQKKIFCAFTKMHYLEIFEKEYVFTTTHPNPLEEIYFSILSNRERCLEIDNGEVEEIEIIIFEKITKNNKLNLMKQTKECQIKYKKLAEIILENKSFIFPEK